MRDSGIILLAFAVVGAVAVSSLTNVAPTLKPANTTPVDTVNCVDYDPPSTSDQVALNGKTYNLLKKDGSISKDKIKREFKDVGTLPDGRKAFNALGKNYFGQPIGPEVLYVDSGKTKGNNGIFDMYFQDGVAIPDYIKNCKKTGGDRRTIDYWRTSQFPPQAFNATDAKGSAVLQDPAYLHDDVVKTYNEVVALNGVQEAGTLFVPAKNQSYQLYYHLASVYLIDGNSAYEYLPTDRPVEFGSDAKANLQLKWFMLVNTPQYSWFTPNCKPAIYLYPENSQKVSVKVHTPGEFTLTIPEYPANGWEVVADPDGTVHSGGQIFPYLYYESTIPDSLVHKPSQGYVRGYDELSTLYNEVLPKLGLNVKETKEFKEYWEKVLPYSPYYFVGVMTEAEVNNLEPLEISPKPDTLVRVRFYFQPLKERAEVEEPVLRTPERKGFVASEWGGMVKLHEGSSFTCNQ
jgi:hypothetical protein